MEVEEDDRECRDRAGRHQGSAHELSDQTAQAPAAYQFLTLSDGAHTQDGVAGIGAKGGPDPSHVGRSSVGWRYQTAEEGFKPTEVVLEVSAWKATWSLE